MELPLNILRSVRNYKTIDCDGLTLYPILVKEYSEFLLAQPALEVMHQSLPVAMMRMPLLQALYQMDFDAVVSGQTPTGLFQRTRLALALSFRLGIGQDIVERIELIRVVVERNNPQKLIGLRFTDNDGKEQNISPSQYKTLRLIIAAQNGVKVEDEKANPSIVQAQKDMMSGHLNLDANIDDLITAVATLAGTDEDEIDEWPILKLTKRSESYRRILDYLVCGIGETNGATWKNGNPVPHPFFRRLQDGNGLFSPFGGGTGKEKSTSQNTPYTVTQAVQQSHNL